MPLSTSKQLPLFEEPLGQGLPTSRSSLDFGTVYELYSLVDWGMLSHHPQFRSVYKQGEYAPLSMFKAIALCFLHSIPHDYALAELLQENAALRHICGFFDSTPPQRINFYRFRYQEYFPEIMRLTLVAIAMAARRLYISIPFVTYQTELSDSVWLEPDTFSLGNSKTTVKVWKSPLPEEARRQGLGKNLQLPAKVALYDEADKETTSFIMSLPVWARDDLDYRGRDTVMGRFSKPLDPYVACNVLLVQEHQGQKQILLSKRLNTSWSGYYGVPGGKRRLGQSIEYTAIRELREETTMNLLRSRPISVRITHFLDHPVVASIGVLVEDYSGSPESREEKHGPWEWWPLDGLPTPLFPPTQFVLQDFARGDFGCLTWPVVEAMFEHFDSTPKRLEELSNIFGQETGRETYQDSLF